MSEPVEILNAALRRANENLDLSLIPDQQIRERADYISRNLKNRAGTRLLMACLLAKLHHPDIDVRKPYTEIGDSTAFNCAAIANKVASAAGFPTNCTLKSIGVRASMSEK